MSYGKVKKKKKILNHYGSHATLVELVRRNDDKSETRMISEANANGAHKRMHGVGMRKRSMTRHFPGWDTAHSVATIRERAATAVTVRVENNSFSVFGCARGRPGGRRPIIKIIITLFINNNNSCNNEPTTNRNRNNKKKDRKWPWRR